jgi:hypothetical protein
MPPARFDRPRPRDGSSLQHPRPPALPPLCLDAALLLTIAKTDVAGVAVDRAQVWSPVDLNGGLISPRDTASRPLEMVHIDALRAGLRDVFFSELLTSPNDEELQTPSKAHAHSMPSGEDGADDMDAHASAATADVSGELPSAADDDSADADANAEGAVGDAADGMQLNPCDFESTAQQRLSFVMNNLVVRPPEGDSRAAAPALAVKAAHAHAPNAAWLRRATW